MIQRACDILYDGINKDSIIWDIFEFDGYSVLEITNEKGKAVLLCHTVEKI